MGGWISSLQRFKNFLFKPKQLSIETVGDPNRDPLELLSAAAEIAALHIMENTEETNTNFKREEEEESSISYDSEESYSCITSRPQKDMFRKGSKMAFTGHITVGDQQAFRELRERMQHSCHELCSASTSIAELCSRREILKPHRGSSMCLGIKTSIVNQFLPNRRRVVDKIRSKSFCCQFVKDGTEMFVASQDERIRFFQQYSPRARYILKDTIHVPVTSWSILDVAMNPRGDALCYGTWRDAVFYARLFEPSSDSPGAVSWTELDIPNQDTNMAVFSLRFSQQGHEILCGGSDRGLHIFDLESVSRVVTINDAHVDEVNAVCYGDTGSHLLYSGGDDGLLKVYDRRALGETDYQPVGVFAGHRDGITYIDARGDDRHLISNSKDQTIKLWDLRRFSSAETMQLTLSCVRHQSWDYRWQPAPSTNNSLLEGDTSIITLRGHSVLHTLIRAKFSPSRTGRRYIYTGCARGNVVIYDLLANSSNPIICRLPGHVGVVRDVDWHPTNNEIVSSAWDGITSVWEWDGRYDNITSSDVSRSNAEDSCVESYKPVMKRRKNVKRTNFT